MKYYAEAGMFQYMSMTYLIILILIHKNWCIAIGDGAIIINIMVIICIHVLMRLMDLKQKVRLLKHMVRITITNITYL